jgi:rod shape determining protein RodA
MRLEALNLWLLLLPLLLIGIGLLNLYSIENFPPLGWSHKFYRQLVWAGVAIVGMVIASYVEGAFWRYFAYVIYGGSIGLMALTALIGREVNGAQAWLEIGGLRLQPSEFGKIATALALSRYLESSPNFSWRRWQDRGILSFLIVFPMGLALLQKDAGTALTYGAFIVPLYRYGLNGWLIVLPLILAVLAFLTLLYPWYMVAGAGVLIGLAAHWAFRRWGLTLLLMGSLVGWAWLAPQAYEHLLAPHQRRRVEVLLDPSKDPLGAGWNGMQVRIAIEAGGLIGTGYGQGLQSKLDFIPQRHTDFAFCGIAEEWGWMGGSVLILLYLVLMWHLSIVAERSNTTFGLIYGYSLLGIVLIHFIINLGMIVGLLPVIGIPLPFLSYGGSAWVALAGGMGIMQRLWRERSLRLFG